MSRKNKTNETGKVNGIKIQGLSIDVNKVTSPNHGSLESPPGLALATSSTSSSSSSPYPRTPHNQPIQNQTSAKEREETARTFIFIKELGFTYDDLDKDGKARAKRLMSKDYSWSPRKEKKGSNHDETSFREEFDKFVAKFACEKPDLDLSWKDNVFFDDEAIDSYLVIRMQRSGICYMHAVVILQHILFYLRTKMIGSNHKMLDISAYIRENFSKQKLEKFLKKGGGGSSVEFFREITGNPNGKLHQTILSFKRSDDEIGFQLGMRQICHCFNTLKEPALVSEFAIEKDFKKTDKFVYDGEVKKQLFLDYGKERGYPEGNRVFHSMVMIGLSEDKKTGKIWFLLQNFWKKDYFVVVSDEYLASCEAKVTFVPKSATVTLLKENFEMTDDIYVETETELEEECECGPEEED